MRRPMVQTPPGTKWCPRCAMFLPTSEFAPSAVRPDHLDGYCREHRRLARESGRPHPSFACPNCGVEIVIVREKKRPGSAPEGV